jgi:hypothetical protein
MTAAATTTLLNTLSAFLLVLQGSHASPAAQQTAINIAENGVQLAAQAVAMPHIPFAIAPNDSVPPNIADLGNAAYRDGDGNWVRLGNGVNLIEGDTSFGDLNHDGVDDAAVIVEKPSSGGGVNYFLDAMLNQGGIMFDIAEVPLGAALTVTSHEIVPGTIFINDQQYQLFGTQLSAI